MDYAYAFLDLSFIFFQQQKGFDLMTEVASNTTKKGRHLVRAAQYNLGRAYFQGYGCRQSDEAAEK